MNPLELFAETLLTQYKNSPNLTAYLKCFADEAQEIYELVDQCTYLRYYDVAEGAQLDVVGQLVGATRLLKGVVVSGNFGYLEVAEALGMGRQDDPSLGGPLRSINDELIQDITLTDELFRNWINARILKNSTRCNTEDCITFFKLLLNRPTLSVEVVRHKNAGVTITLHAKLSPHEAALVKSLGQHIKPFGVEFIVQDLRGVIETLPVNYRDILS